jgi:hypothetical protein
MKNLKKSETTICGECGEFIRWSDYDDSDDIFNSVLDKLIHHINNDTKCVRERKINELLETKEKLAQDYWIR